ncbi:MAG: ribose-phosphate diphosphokinase, partial [Gammaproteobacteria bacterium]|nr:ribose-phosphate diphosphokinase [Gammaproteobacteria bacterium]
MLKNIATLTFENSREQAERFSTYLDIPCYTAKTHKFPDEEILLTLPTDLPEHLIVFRSLHQPNDKIIEILLAAKTALKHNVKRLTLIAPYLCYMRQDIENHPGEAISQQIIGELLASTFDDVITVDSHLHRISHLSQAIPLKNAINIMATGPMSEFLQDKCDNAIIFGPDGESEQWVKQIAEEINVDYAVATKVRIGDKHVDIHLPDKDFSDKNIVIVDDMASTGRTISLATKLLKKAGAKTVTALVTHALFMG